jgi:hypothetical protein
MRVTRVGGGAERRRAADDDKLYFHVYASTSGDGVCGYATGSVMAYEGEAIGSVTFVHTGFGVPAREAWEEARGLAERGGFSEVLVFDPDGLFPAAA